MFKRRRDRTSVPGRLARLRPEYAARYPKVPVDRWLPADKLLRQARRAGPLPERAELERIFEFQGGDPRNPAWPYLRQRKEDTPRAAGWYPGHREGRLKPDAAHLFPEIVPGMWLDARELTEIVRRMREEFLALWHPHDPLLQPGERVLPQEHFEFRSGFSEPGSPRLRTRLADLLEQERIEREERAQFREPEEQPTRR